MSGTFHRRGAFSLAEVLIALVIVSLLAAIIAPAGTRLMALGRSVQCKANLQRIGESFGAFRAEDELNKSGAQFAAANWRKALLPYLSDNTKVFFCPEDINPTFSLPKSYITIYNGGTPLYTIQLFDAHPYWFDNAHNDFQPDKPGMWCVNDDVYNDPSFNRYDMPRYTPGEDPNVSWWVIEDQRYGDNFEMAGGDEDFNDLNIKLTDLGGGVFTVEAFHGDAGYNFGIIGPGGEEYRESGGKIGPLQMLGAGGSYGVNWRASNFELGIRRVLAMDYGESVIYAGGDIGETNNWEANAVARHLGKTNVVMSDGSVESHELDRIDPNDPKIDAEMWDPSPGAWRSAGD
ncbi:MAG: type II secretion system protein [Planctomycetota bacterium]|jgi:prepilin-type N-terminal cleavage/methylation domain-containing protein/prepilin-type processing-associated H-X9-DG protein